MSGRLNIGKSKAAGRWWPRIAGGAALVVAAAVHWFFPGAMQSYGHRVFDAYQRHLPREAADVGVRIVDIDDESIARLGQWPWPRTRLAAMTDRLFEVGAGVVAYDMVFSESDRTSPEQLVDVLAENGAPASVIEGLSDYTPHDDLFGATLEGYPVMLGYFLSRGQTDADPASRVGAVVLGDAPDEGALPFGGVIPSLPAITRGAYDQGFLSLEPDSDNIIRRAPLVVSVGGTVVPSLSLAVVRYVREVMGDDAGAYLLSTSTRSGEWAAASGGQSVFTGVRVGQLDVPVTAEGEMWLHFRDRARTIPTLPAWKLLDPSVPDAELEAFFTSGSLGAGVVFVGTSAQGLNDLRSTPMASLVPGVEVHAEAAEQMLADTPKFLAAPDWAAGLRMGLLVGVGLLLVILVPMAGPLAGGLVGLLAVGGLIGASFFAYRQHGLLLDPVYPVVALGGVYGVTALIRFLATELQRSHISGAFSRYLSPDLVARIADDPGQLRLGGEERDMTVLFCDIRGFSKISERMSSAEVTQYLNRFLTPMTDALLSHQATLDKYIGDAIMAFWNAPLDDPDHERHAARAALAMQARLDVMNRRPGDDPDGLPVTTVVGIGMQAGPCSVGNMGSDQRFAYSVLGDTVNSAARLEGMTKLYEAGILVGEELAARLDGFALLELDRVRAVGKEEPMTVFALVGDEDTAAMEAFETLAAAQFEFLRLYRDGQFANALEYGQNLGPMAGPFGLEGYYRMMGKRLAEYLEMPPSDDWDGITVLTQK